MKMNPTSSDNSPYISTQVKAQLDKAKKKVMEGDQDRVYVITGREGLGKSTLAFQIAHYLDATFSIDDIVFTAQQFEKRIREAKKFKAIVFDECFNGLSSKGSLSKENKNLVRLLMECRQRNLFIFLVLPSFFLLERYPAIFRSTALFNVLASRKNYKLRYYKIYNYTKKQVLFLEGRKLMSYFKPKIRKKHRFYRKLPPTVDMHAYNKKKMISFMDIGQKEPEESRYRQQRDFLIQYIHENYEKSTREVSKIFNDAKFPLSTTQIHRIIHNAP